MHDQAMFARSSRRRIDAVERDRLPMPAVLQSQQARNGAMFIIRLYRAGNGIRIETAVGSRLNRRKHDAAKNRRPAGFIDEDVIVMAGQDFLAALAMCQHRAKI